VLGLARNPIKINPLAVIFLTVTTFGSILLVNFFPECATQVQVLLLVQPAHYHGVIARILRIVAFCGQFGATVRVLLEMVSLVRNRCPQVTRLLRPSVHHGLAPHFYRIPSLNVVHSRVYGYRHERRSER
jgi:hypothetical protein